MKESNQEIIVNISEEQTIIELSDRLQPYKSEIFLKKIYQGSIYEINLKSFLGLITLKIKNGDKIWVRAAGTDCKEALQSVVEYLT
ncbi:HPr family phosphocarrier protein [Halobacillus shinanisalinarum]|uniref:HPr family phosphocarrier protein n=1 Tax=Halobacillus shinanisalinarum TaxID=2932258 RepID=A0ABY4GV37_9BACI|nr:HPr family phosphocarrier protein [Halobacillus shinanisalinarum]UOQ91988.1 HPr family phosphocarrier protein [Halobacillus shinanisalinarum]